LQALLGDRWRCPEEQGSCSQHDGGESEQGDDQHGGLLAFQMDSYPDTGDAAQQHQMMTISAASHFRMVMPMGSVQRMHEFRIH
jgi:hypothetical protein